MSMTVQKQTVFASCFNDQFGYGGIDLNLNDYYAELSSALNNLPYGHRLRITLDDPPRYPSLLATKGSVGPANPDHRRPIIAIHFRIAQAWGFTSPEEFGIRAVIIESA